MRPEATRVPVLPLRSRPAAVAVGGKGVRCKVAAEVLRLRGLGASENHLAPRRKACIGAIAERLMV